MISQRARNLKQSQIRAMTQRCHELDGINMGQGVCDTPPPAELIEAVMPAIQAGHNTYSRYDGITRLRNAIADKLQRHNGLTVDPESEVLVTLGTGGGFAAAMTALLNPGDRILMFEPYYGYHYNTARVAELQVDLLPMNFGDFSLDLEALEQKAAGAKALVINSPGNPTGRVFTYEELESIAEICQRHDLLCISDEIYEYFLFDGRRHISMATLPGMRERTLTLSGYSKTFSITGWRIGFLAATRKLAAPIGLVADLYYACAPTPLQHAVATAIETLDDTYYSDLATGYQRKRDQFCAALQEAGLTPHVPEGAYYVLADVSAMNCSTAAEAAMQLLEGARIASIPGTAFFSSGHGEKLLRFCFGKEQPVLDQACAQLAQWRDNAGA